MNTSPFRSVLIVCGVATFGLVACGAEESQPQPISFSLAASTRSASDAIGTPESSNSSSKIMAPNYSVEYVVDGKLADLGKEASSWRAQTNVVASDADLKKIATALGVKNTEVQISSGDPYLSWYYSGAVSSEASSPPSVGMNDSDAATTAPDRAVVSPPVPENVPTKKEAQSIIQKMLAKMDVDVDDANIELNGDEYGVWVTAWETFDGMRSPMSWNIGLGANGAVTYAQGNFLEFTKGANYPVVSTTEAVKRLGDSRYSGWFGYGAVSSKEVLAQDMTPIPAQEDVVQTIRLTKVSASLTPVIASDTTLWLLPSYEYLTSEGYTVSALALDDKYIEQTPISTVPDSDGDVSVPGAGSGSSGSSTGATPPVDGGVVEPLPAPQTVLPTENDAEALVGLSEDEAVKIIEGNGWTYRIGSRDGEQFMLTQDYLTSRLTLGIEKSIVVTATIG
ncbi:MAG: hypothetical protein NWP73_05755 [Ilumatobacteraceae bacterium]|jgi:hypothetical protein|nr:hypothetical protein [Ilumatobacteraceae bacterium]MDP4702753.1 hypothetical protein [Ilumatobacteraceae bacterium]MDP5109251.1 hypothetical protein [Ilumatobacteraceae bacterium]